MKLHRIAAAVISLCVWSVGTSLPAELFVEDTFTGYLDNALISAGPAGPGIGLSGDWSVVPNSDFFVNKTRDDDSAGTGKAVYERPAGDNGTRTATRSTSADHVLYENDGDVFYASFLIDPADSQLANGRMTFELELSRLDGGGVPNFSFGIIDGAYSVGNGGIDVDASGGTVTAAEQLVLVRIEYGDGSDDNEIVTLWVDPADESSTPVINGASVDFLNSGGGKVTSISMRGENMLGHPAFFDNLRVGSSFASVVPEPSTLTLLALGLIALVPVIRRRR